MFLAGLRRTWPIETVCPVIPDSHKSTPTEALHPNPKPHLDAGYESDTRADIIIPRRMPGSAVFGLNEARKGTKDKLFMGARKRG